MAFVGKVHVIVAIAAIGVLLFAASSGPALAKTATDPGDSSDPNFDIKTYGFQGNSDNIFVQLYGKAARTLPTEDHMGFAYVFVTDNGVWAINGHREAHSTDVPEWHAERIFVDGSCIQGIDVGTERTTLIAGTNAIVKDTGASEIFAMQTVQFHLNVDEPDNPPPGTECIGTVVQVFDEA